MAHDFARLPTRVPRSSAHLLQQPAATGSWNMAVDAALLESAARHDRITLRLYAWSEPTLSLGYFQSAADRAHHLPSSGCPLVRRATGGGAIIHDREITYSLTIPRGCRQFDDHQRYYELCHQAWIFALARQGTAADRCPADDPHTSRRFLCFQRRTRGDLVMGDHKIGGSAQRQHRAQLLQHGSLLLERSPAAPELPGINDLRRRAALPDIDRQQLLEDWTGWLAGELQVAWTPTTLDEVSEASAEAIESSHFGSHQWNHKR